jgi:hypothetical protein
MATSPLKRPIAGPGSPIHPIRGTLPTLPHDPIVHGSDAEDVRLSGPDALPAGKGATMYGQGRMEVGVY